LHYGTALNKTTVAIVAPGDPLAAGLSGTPTVTTSGSQYTWGRPGASATVIARIAGSATNAAIFNTRPAPP